MVVLTPAAMQHRRQRHRLLWMVLAAAAILIPAGPAAAHGASPHPPVGDGSPADRNISFVGRWDTSDPTAYVPGWAGAYLRTGFTGTTVKLKQRNTIDLYYSIDGAGVHLPVQGQRRRRPHADSPAAGPARRDRVLPHRGRFLPRGCGLPGSDPGLRRDHPADAHSPEGGGVPRRLHHRRPDLQPGGAHLVPVADRRATECATHPDCPGWSLSAGTHGGPEHARYRVRRHPAALHQDQFG